MYKRIVFIGIIIATVFFIRCKVSQKAAVAKKTQREICADLDTFIMKGTYIGGNLSYSNPYVNCADTTICYSVSSVRINDTIVLKPNEINKPAIEIELRNIGYKMNTKIKLEMIYVKNYAPELMHPKRDK